MRLMVKFYYSLFKPNSLQELERLISLLERKVAECVSLQMHYSTLIRRLLKVRAEATEEVEKALIWLLSKDG